MSKSRPPPKHVKTEFPVILKGEISTTPEPNIRYCDIFAAQHAAAGPEAALHCSACGKRGDSKIGGPAGGVEAPAPGLTPVTENGLSP